MHGVYIASHIKRQGNREYFYDTLRDEEGQEKFTLCLTQHQRENLRDGNLIDVGGVLNHYISDSGHIKIFLKVSRIEVVREQAVDELEIGRMELRRKKSEAGFKNVDAIIENLLYTDKRPGVALVFAYTSITDSDFNAGVNASKADIDFEEYRVNFSNSTELIRLLRQIDGMEYDIISIIRGGGDSIEKLDGLNVLNAIVELRTPIICAIGHVEDKLFIKQLVDKVVPTPLGLGKYFSEMVEKVNEKKTQSKAVLIRQIECQFKDRLESEQKQNRELHERLRILTETYRKAVETQQSVDKKRNEQIEVANKNNKERQEELGRSLIKMRETNTRLQRSLNICMWIAVLAIIAIIVILIV